MGLLQDLGVDGPKLIAQLINFAIVLFVLLNDFSVGKTFLLCTVLLAAGAAMQFRLCAVLDAREAAAHSGAGGKDAEAETAKLVRADSSADNV